MTCMTCDRMTYTGDWCLLRVEIARRDISSTDEYLVADEPTAYANVTDALKAQ